MSRLLLFLSGLLLGAAGVVALFATGTVRAPGALPVQGIPAAQVAPAEQGVAPPEALVEAATVSKPAEATPLAPLPVEPPPPLAVPPAETAAPAAASSSANASEMSVPTTTEGAAAVTAANSSGSLLIPVQGMAASKLVDTFTQSRGAGRLHDAIDIMAARGTPVLAVADGRVAKLFTSKPGGLTIYQFDGAEKLAYYYAHLDHYAAGLAEGQQLKRGDTIGYVGSTGNASPDAPHLHFAVFVLGPDKKWWQGTAVNPYPLLGGR
jgi:murein DD-endopeptidase MepM/ murein hydrolase activator NlpD